MQLRIVIADLSRLLLDKEPLILNLVNLLVLRLQLLLNLLFLQLELLNLRVKLVEFGLLSLNLLIVVLELLLTLLPFSLAVGELLLGIEQVVLGFSKVLLSDPQLPLFVSLLADDVLELGMLLVELVFHGTVSGRKSVNLLLQALTLVGLSLYSALHFVDLALPFSYLVLQLVSFLTKIVHSGLLKVNLAVLICDLVFNALHDHVLRFTSMILVLSCLHLCFLFATVLQFKFKEFLSFVGVELLPLAELSDFYEQLLLVHFTLDVVQHRDRNVIDHFQTLID